MLENIPPPTYPSELTAPVAYLAGGAAVLVGLLMVLWGRKLGRAFMVVIGAGGGFLLAPLLIARLNVPENAVRFVAVFALAILALVAARLVWALLAGAGGLLIGAAGVCYRAGDLVLQHRPVEFGPTDTFLQWLDSLGRYLGQWVQGLSQVLPPALYVFVGACVAVTFLLVLVWPRMGGVLMTALTGAVLAVAGGLLVSGRLSAELWTKAWTAPLVPAGVLGALALAGWIVQGRSEIKKARAAKAEEDEEAEPAADAAPAKAGKKKAPKTARTSS